MGEHEAQDLPDGVAGLPQAVVVDVAVLGDPDARSFRARIARTRGDTRRRVIAVLTLVLATAGAGTLWLGNRDPSPSLTHLVARERGPTGFAGAYGRPPPNCLSVTILTVGGTHAQADVNHRTLCGRYTGYPTPIFKYVSGTWRPVLDAIPYVCPIASLPARLQGQRDVCLPTRADRLALER